MPITRRRRIVKRLVAAFGILVCSAMLHGQVSVLTWHNDNGRTGQNLQETALTTANVKASTFGKLFVISVDGKVDAQPLYVPLVVVPGKGTHNVLYVATEHDSVYAFDADTGTQLWHVSMLNSGETTSDSRNCDQVAPEIGVTSTPAIDLQSGPHGTIYVVAMSKDGSNNYHHRLHALDLTTGAEQFGGPNEVQATYPGTGDGSASGTLTFDPGQYKDRSGLLISNGVVYTSWASHCDIFPYTGWVIGYSEANLSRVSVVNLTPNGGDGAIWAAGAGPAADAGGNVYLLTGNGTFDTTLTPSGFPISGDYGNAFVKLSASLQVMDYFTMANTAAESGGDVDLGSGGLMLIPQVNDAQGHARNLAVGAGKDGNVYVVDTANMGKFNPNQNVIYQELMSAVSGVFSSPAWFNGRLYYGAQGDRLKAFAFMNGAFGTGPASQTANGFVYPGTTPSISANGSSNGILWAHENASPAVLHAFDANDLSKELYNSNQAANGRDHFGSGNKFIVPMVANGKVYVGTTNGVGVLGLLCGGSILPLSANIAAGGGSGMVNVTAGGACQWTASSNVGFINITGGSAGTGNGSVSYTVLPNTGAARTGTVTIAGQTFTIKQAGIAPVPGDFDLDGTPDLVWQNDTTRQVTVQYYGGALGAVFQGWNFLNAGGIPGWTVVGAADFNGDGVPDLIWQNDTTRQVTVQYYGGAQGAVFQGWAWLNATGIPGWTVVGAADFNGDGVPDLIWQNDATRKVTVQFYGGTQGAVFQGWAWLNSAGIPGWTVAGANDFDKNGTPDLVWQNDTTRQVTVHFFNGGLNPLFTGWAWLNKSGIPGWRVIVPR